jgi:carboxyl-terminal processing protease
LLKLFGDCLDRVIKTGVGDTDLKRIVDAAIVGLVVDAAIAGLAPGHGTDEELIDDALNGMLQAVDPHSNFLNEKSFSEMKQQTYGQFGGVGMEVAQSLEGIGVVSPLDGEPAARAGIEPGDVITEIDGASLQGMNLAQAAAQLRGPVNTVVVVTVKRVGKEPFRLTLVRSTIGLDPVRWHLDSGVIGYVRITSLNDPAGSALENAVKDLKQQSNNKLSGIVLDLRSCPGGLLDQAIGIADALLDKGNILTVRGRGAESVARYAARPGDISGGLPLVVMINHDTASECEIIAAALQDNHRASILGNRSLGKGSLQTVFSFPGHGAMRLTTDLYITPSGQLIQGQGVTPDKIVNISKATGGPVTPVTFGSSDDRQYVAAVDLVRSLIGAPAAHQ